MVVSRPPGLIHPPKSRPRRLIRSMAQAAWYRRRVGTKHTWFKGITRLYKPQKGRPVKLRKPIISSIRTTRVKEPRESTWKKAANVAKNIGGSMMNLFRRKKP